MPTFFARRYMRNSQQVGNTEKLLGVFILLLLAAIVATFVVQSTTNKDYLFNVDQEAYGAQQAAREVAVARQMLPALDGLGWEAAGKVGAIPADRLSASLGEPAADLAQFGVQCVYRRRYETPKQPSLELVVMVCDACSAAQAFGLCRARQPEAGEALDVGRGGWHSPVRAGFWNGRYYTELRLSGEPADTATLPAVASAVAAEQLGYGRPFWAETMLPPHGRVPGSFRYVHRHALGSGLLNQVFLVELAGGTTAWVTDAKSAAAAGALVERFKAPGWRQEGPLTIVPFGAGELALLTAGPYVHGAYGKDSAGVVASAMSAYAMVAPEGPGAGEEITTVQAAQADNPLAAVEVPGWQAPRQASHYSADNLYVKINGRAGAYLQFHVVGLDFGTYCHPTDRQRTIDVYWYDMGEPANAFGIYRSEAPQDAEPVSIGRDGYQTGGAVFFWKNASYVQVLPAGLDEAYAQAALAIARRIAEQIEEGDESLWGSAVLPQAGRLADSLQFLASDPFGLEFLRDVFTADYEMDGREVTLFIHRAKDATSARALLDQYEQFFEQHGKVIWSDPDASRQMLAGSVSGVIDVVFVKGRYLGGVAGAEDAELAEKAATTFHEHLPAANRQLEAKRQ